MNRRERRHFQNIRIFAATGVLLSLVAILLVWTTGMHMNQNHECILAQLQNSDCATISGFQNIAFHVNAFTQFVNGASMIQASIWSFLLLIAVAFLGLLFPDSASPPFRTARHVFAAAPVTREHLRWLSLFEHSPSLTR